MTHICPPDHKHSVNTTCYAAHACRCVPCRENQRKREVNRRKQIAYGRYDSGLVDAEPVRDHVLMLQAFGYGWKRIAEMSGVGNTAVESLIYGRKGSVGDPRHGEVLKRTTREKAEKLLAVKPDLDSLAGGARIPSRGAQRRIQALVRVGWSQSHIATLIGMETTNFPLLLKRPEVTMRVHRAIAAVFDDLWDQEPPLSNHRERQVYSRMLNHAKKRRWLPPLAWDDIDNDIEPPVSDEFAGIDEMAVELAMGGESVRLSYDERREAITRLCAVKLSDGQIAARLHIADRTVWRIRGELGIAASLGADGQVAA